jgi:putative ABC transport system substrate-binding protein
MPALQTAPEEGLREGLRQLGYVEGNNIAIDWRRSSGTPQELLSIASALARAKVALIVTTGAPATRAALKATQLPVVFAPVGDAVENGFATSLARPGGNASGVTAEGNLLAAKRLELLTEALPAARRFGYLMNSSSPIESLRLGSAKKAAAALRVEVTAFDARSDSEVDHALSDITHSKVQGVFISPDLLLLANKSKIAATMRTAKLPAMFPLREYHDEGVLMSYGIDLKESMRRAAPYVDKILRGAKPADIPIEQVSKFELIVDLRVARQMGIRLPQDLLLLADEVIR